MSRKKTQAAKDVAYARKNAERAKKAAQKLAKEKIKEMRPYLKRLKQIDLRKTIGPAQRAAITKAYKDYEKLTVRPTRIYRTKNKTRLNAVQEFSQMRDNRTKFDVAFVPVAEKSAKLRINKKGEVSIKTPHVDLTRIWFDLENLAVDPRAEIQRILDENPNAKTFLIMAGAYEYNGTISRGALEKKIMQLIAKYSQVSENNYFANWLFGVINFTAKNQSDIDAYRIAYKKAGAAGKKIKRSKRRRRLRDYGSK